MTMLNNLLEKGIVPDRALRFGIKQLIKKRLKDEYVEGLDDVLKQRYRELSEGEIAIHTKDANEQHYEVPTEFYDLVLGKWKKYSSGFWENGAKDIDESEAHMLELYIERAQIKDGMEILDLGCGWGSLTLYLANKFPNCKITSVSNSKTQKQFIDQTCQLRGHHNVQVKTCDINDLELEPKKYDRIISIEMFEHMRNYKLLLEKVSRWLKDDGLLFVHIFTHRELTYYYDVVDETDWMSKYFFSGGIMPGHNLFEKIEAPMKVHQKWKVNGQNYWKTSEAWLENQDKHKDAIMKVFIQSYGGDAKKWFEYWRLFFLACAELFRYKNGQEWFVSHYVLKKEL